MTGVQTCALPISGTALYVDAGGIIGTLSSSERYKKNIRDLADSNFIYSLRPVIYDAKDGSAQNCEGLIAEEVDLVAPNLVRYKKEKVMATRKDEFGDDEEYIKEWRQTDIPDGVHYDRLIVPMLKEIKKHHTILTNLIKRVSSLEAA